MKQIKKAIILITLPIFFASLLNANETLTHNTFYVEPKVVYTFGETVKHKSSSLQGESGLGIGLDFGYIFSKYFALELDGTFSKSKVKETNLLGEINEDTVMYYTYGINTVFTYPIKNHIILLTKLGYGSEHEDLGALNIKGSEQGATWAIGFEYEFNRYLEISAEYEGADIRSTKGDSLQLGLIYKF